MDRSLEISPLSKRKLKKKYLSLEKLRFEDDLNIVYDIEATSFMIPTLSVQPLVENAVKYGVCQKENGGTYGIRATYSG